MLNKMFRADYSKELEMRFSDEVRLLSKGLNTIDTSIIANDSELEWALFVNKLRDNLQNSRHNQFLKWREIRQTMFTPNTSYIIDEFKYLKRFNKNKLHLAKENKLGQPSAFFPSPEYSSNNVHHLFHICQYEEITKRDINEYDFIVEFGGGYGNLSKIIRMNGFKGRYIIFDFRHFNLLQYYYLNTLGFKASFENNDDTYLESDIEKFKEFLKNLPLDNSLLIATWSFSETPIEFRKTLENYFKSFNNYLIAYQHKFNEVNNVEYFDDFFKARNNQFNSQTKFLKGNNYLFA